MVQYAVGVVIFSSYISSIVGSELLPDDGTAQAHFFKVLEYLYTAIFAAELAMNMFGSWFWPFFTSGWNIFDFLVVISSLIALIFPVLLPRMHDSKDPRRRYSARAPVCRAGILVPGFRYVFSVCTSYRACRR